MIHDVRKEVKPIVLTNSIKERAHMIPQGYLDAPVMKDVEDPIRTKANWIANAWHCGVAEFLIAEMLEGAEKKPSRWRRIALPK